MKFLLYSSLLTVLTFAALMEKLEEYAEKFPDRVRLVKKAKVVDVIKDGQGIVNGVVYETDGQLFEEHGPVILATGGYAADFTETVCHPFHF